MASAKSTVPEAKITTFPAHCVEHLHGLVQGVIVVLDADLGRTLEESRVHGFDLAPSPLDAASGLSMTTSSDCAHFCAIRGLSIRVRSTTPPSTS